MDAKKKLKAKRSGLRVIDQGTRMDALGNLKRMTRKLEDGEYGRVRAFAGFFICGFGADRRIHNAAFGVANAEEQRMAALRLADWLERDDEK